MNQKSSSKEEDKRIRLPFAANATGRFNGDMFADWYNGKEPKDELEYQLWDFLHRWTKGIKKQNADKLDQILKKIEELT